MHQTNVWYRKSQDQAAKIGSGPDSIPKVEVSMRIGGVSAIIAVVLFTTVLQTPALASSKNSQQRFVQVPIFFATTRMPCESKEHYCKERNFNQSTQGVDYGIVTIGVEYDKEINKEAQSALNWKFVDKLNRKILEVHVISRGEFFDQVANSAQRRNKNNPNICIFVHGYNNKFSAAVASAARLALALEEPVILFSWPSQGKLWRYTVDECNIEWSLRPFQVFMQSFEDHPDRIMTVSHSMGNRLLNWYLQSRYDKSDGKPNQFSEIVLTSPDIDRATFTNYFFKVAQNAKKTRLYVSKRDRALWASKIVHGSSRAGSATDDPQLNWELPGAIEGTQTVNFTDVDRGPIGHSIQYDIISSMHRSNDPGPGLSAIPDPTFKGDYVRIKNQSK
jgi:esterase/lipase superfamily enzyme